MTHRLRGGAGTERDVLRELARAVNAAGHARAMAPEG
jgi:hypothetical protein